MPPTKMCPAAEARIDETARQLVAVFARIEGESAKRGWRDMHPQSEGWAASTAWVAGQSALNDGEAVDAIADSAFSIALAVERARQRWLGE